jgi:hypothetical protein
MATDLAVVRCGDSFFDIRDDGGVNPLCQIEQQFCVLHSAVNYEDALEAICFRASLKDSVLKDHVFSRARITPKQKAIIVLHRHFNNDSHDPKLWREVSIPE